MARVEIRPQALPAIPRSVQQALGEEATTDFSRWLELVLVERAVRRDEYREVISRLDILEHDVGELKNGLGKLNERFDHLEARIDERYDQSQARMDQQYDRLLARIDERYDQSQARMDEQYDRLLARMDEQYERLHERFDLIYERTMVMTRWTIGAVTLLGTIMTILFAIAQFIRP